MAPPFGEDQGSADSIGKSWQREIFPQTKEWKIGEYFVYFLFFILYGWRKRSAVQPQAIDSEFPQLLISLSSSLQLYSLRISCPTISEGCSLASLRMALK